MWSSSSPGLSGLTLRSRAAAAVGLAAILVIGCGRPSATTTSAPPAPTTTTQASQLTSQDVAVAFFEAWQSGDRPAMGELAEPVALAEADALSDLASRAWEPELCEGAAGTVHCIWVSDAGVLAIGVRNIEEPHLVTSFGLVEP
jgi:hypothetical protein